MTLSAVSQISNLLQQMKCFSCEMTEYISFQYAIFIYILGTRVDLYCHETKEFILVLGSVKAFFILHLLNIKICQMGQMRGDNNTILTLLHLHCGAKR